jgi:Uma2 family endonuclease
MKAMPTAAKKRATYQDVLDAPPHKVAEVLDGDLYIFDRPAGPHCSAASVLGVMLGGPFGLGRDGPGGWRILDEPELHFGEGDTLEILVPDVAGWRRERLPTRPTGAYITTPPDWICEVLSPSTSRVDRAQKMPIYARVGVPHAWLIDPVARTLEHFELAGPRWMLAAVHSGTGAVRVPPFDAIELDLRVLFED